MDIQIWWLPNIVHHLMEKWVDYHQGLLSKRCSISAFLKHERGRVTYGDRKLSLRPRELKERPPTMQLFSCDELSIVN